MLEKPFNLLWKHPKTPRETPEDSPVSEIPAVMTFKHMVGLVKKIWLGFPSMLRGSPGFVLKAYEIVTLALSGYVLLL